MRRYIQPLLIIIIAFVATGCVGTKYLKEGEYLLYNQKVQSSNQAINDNLSNQFVQKHNSRVWFLPVAPYTFVYYQGLKSYDTTRYELKKRTLTSKHEAKLISNDLRKKKVDRNKKTLDKKIGKINKKIDEGNLLMRWGEPIVVFDSAKVEKSRRNIEVFMKSNSWLKANVDYEANFDGKIATVNYSINEGPGYLIDTILYDIADTAVRNIVFASHNKRHIKVGDPYSQNNLSAERARIDGLLKNNGYFDFTRQYIRFRIDSTAGNNAVMVQLRILKPENRSRHKSFTIDAVNFAVDHKNITKGPRQAPFKYNGVTYKFNDIYYAEKVLASRIHLNPGAPYSKQNTLNTQRELAGMDMFKFVNINYDSTANQFKANIFVSPLHRYQWTAEAGLTVTQYLPGPFASISLKQRNVFKTLGILEISGNIGVEGVAAASNPDDILASLDAGANMSLTFPRFFLPVSDETKRKLGLYNPKSTIRGGISFTDRPEYTRSNLSVSNSYTWQPKQHLLYDFRLFEIALLRTNNLDSAYNNRLIELKNNGNNLINSFKPSFISNQRISRSVNNNNYGQGFNNASYFSLIIEHGGTLTNLWAKEFFAKDSLEIYAYIKLDTDYRRIFSTGKNQSWAFRVRSGVALPYGDNGLLPYEKYFFSGGSISNRAWKPRRLGPGSYNHIENNQVSYKFEQQGEFIIESSIEFRQRLIGFLQWAAFVDAGNIWTIKEDNSRPGSQFNIGKFYREIAVGAGLGLRFDFSFFIMRFDASAKVVDPARPTGSRFVFSKNFKDAPFNDAKFTEPIIYTLSIGYPF